MNFKSAMNETLAEFAAMILEGETDTMSKGDCVIMALGMMESKMNGENK